MHSELDAMHIVEFPLRRTRRQDHYLCGQQLLGDCVLNCVALEHS
jgi:hypothetical protein